MTARRLSFEPVSATAPPPVAELENGERQLHSPTAARRAPPRSCRRGPQGWRSSPNGAWGCHRARVPDRVAAMCGCQLLRSNPPGGNRLGRNGAAFGQRDLRRQPAVRDQPVGPAAVVPGSELFGQELTGEAACHRSS